MDDSREGIYMCGVILKRRQLDHKKLRQDKFLMGGYRSELQRTRDDIVAVLQEVGMEPIVR